MMYLQQYPKMFLWLFLALVYISCTEPAEETYPWTLEGSIQAKTNFDVDFKSGQIKIGAFHSSSINFSATVNDITPLAGFATVDSGGKFSFEVAPQTQFGNYIMILVWVDRNNNDKLDALTEVFDLPEESKAFHGSAIYYAYQSIDKKWLGVTAAKAEATSLDQLDLYIKKNLQSLRDSWKITGKIKPKPAYTIAFSSKQIKIGAFQTGAASFAAKVDNVIPNAGVSTLDTNGNFALNIKPESNTKNNYIHVVVWTDRNNNDTLDALSEPYDLPEESKYFAGVGVRIRFDYIATELNWKPASTYTLSNNLSDLDAYIARNLNTSNNNTWKLSGTIKPKTNTLISFASKQIKIGGFETPAPTFSTTVDNLNPNAGVGSVDTSGSFLLSLKPTESDGNFIHTVVWADRNNNNKLDVQTEIYDLVEESKYFNGNLIRFDYVPNDFNWKLASTNALAGSLDSMDIYVDHHLREGNPENWTISGNIQPKLGDTIAFNSKQIKIGAFQSSTIKLSASVPLTPKAGIASVDTNGKFSLAIKPQNNIEPYILITMWVDKNGNGVLENATEALDNPHDISFFNNTPLNFTYNQAEKRWESNLTGQAANDLPNLVLIGTISLK